MLSLFCVLQVSAFLHFHRPFNLQLFFTFLILGSLHIVLLGFPHDMRTLHAHPRFSEFLISALLLWSSTLCASTLLSALDPCSFTIPCYCRAFFCRSSANPLAIHGSKICFSGSGDLCIHELFLWVQQQVLQIHCHLHPNSSL